MLQEQAPGSMETSYDNGEMYCITGTSLNFFTMDKMLDLEWDKAVKQFLQSHKIPCTEATEG